MVYFDHNATTPLHPVAKAAWLDAADRFPGNPSSPHRLGARAEGALTEARERLAGMLGCSPLDIVWTSGASESGNMVFHHGAQRFPPQSEVWISALEHPCVLAAARRHFSGRTRLIPATHEGVVGLDWLAGELAKSRPALIALMAANNETGVLQPWREVLLLCREHPPEAVAQAVAGALAAGAIDGRAVQVLCRRTARRPLTQSLSIDERIVQVKVPTPSISAYNELLRADRSER